MAFSRGKRSLSISDRSGMQFPYVEMKREWNGSFVHFSEYEPKHPQLDPRHHKADPQGLKNARSDTVPGGGCLVQLDLYFWPGQFTSIGMQPGISGDIINAARQVNSSVGDVTITGIDINITVNAISNTIGSDVLDVTITTEDFNTVVDVISNTISSNVLDVTTIIT